MNGLKILKYQINDEEIEVVIKNQTIYATQKAMSELFDVGVSAISKHLKNIFESGELTEKSVVAKMENTAQQGFFGENTKEIKYYNLDAIISVGYRVNSQKATKFRIWATNILKEYVIKGFVLDDERLKYGEKIFNEDFFKELLDRIRSIRASERRIWLQITDVFAEISIDYDKKSQITKEFYATIQNKFHFAITGHTAAEIIYQQADKNKENMGLTTWKYSPNGRILKSDVEIAKNYLPENDIKRLERAVSGFFDYIEDLLENQNLFTMEDFVKSVNRFLEFREFKILDNNGKISKQQALDKAHIEYAEFNKTQKINSDFEKSIKKIK